SKGGFQILRLCKGKGCRAGSYISELCVGCSGIVQFNTIHIIRIFFLRTCRKRKAGYQYPFIFHRAITPGLQAYCLAIRRISNNTICMAELMVPNIRYQSERILNTRRLFAPQVLLVAKPKVMTRPAMPHTRNMPFIAFDSGSIPTADTRLAQGPNCPAYSPASGRI